jgi:hypothetical protein
MRARHLAAEHDQLGLEQFLNRLLGVKAYRVMFFKLDECASGSKTAAGGGACRMMDAE